MMLSKYIAALVEDLGKYGDYEIETPSKIVRATQETGSLKIPVRRTEEQKISDEWHERNSKDFISSSQIIWDEKDV